VVLQQECRASGCPPGAAGAEDIRIGWIMIEIWREYWGDNNV
jgi:hypothetical protein